MNTLWREFIRIVVLVPHDAVMVLLWPLVWGGCLLSIWLAYRTAEFIYTHVFHLTHESFPGLLSALLHSIELLLLIPLPGIVAYRNLRLYLNPVAGNGRRSRRNSKWRSGWCSARWSRWPARGCSSNCSRKRWN